MNYTKVLFIILLFSPAIALGDACSDLKALNCTQGSPCSGYFPGNGSSWKFAILTEPVDVGDTGGYFCAKNLSGPKAGTYIAGPFVPQASGLTKLSVKHC